MVDSGFGSASIDEANRLLAARHYLGPIASGRLIVGERSEYGELVQVQVWRNPTARQVPADWLELSRWCIATDAKNAGSRFMGWARRHIRQNLPVSALVSYSELGHHDGGLYRASGWEPLPTHIAVRWEKDGVGYASGNGSWSNGVVRSPKMRWVIWLSKGARRAWEADRDAG